jgi:hypothetical protein
MNLDDGRAWSRITKDEYAALFPAKPKALRSMAKALRVLAADGEPFTMAQWELAKLAGISVRSWKRYAPVFERYGILEVKRWRYRRIGPTPNTYRVFLPAVIPEDWTPDGGDFPISARETRVTQVTPLFWPVLSFWHASLIDEGDIKLPAWLAGIRGVER